MLDSSRELFVLARIHQRKHLTVSSVHTDFTGTPSVLQMFLNQQNFHVFTSPAGEQ